MIVIHEWKPSPPTLEEAIAEWCPHCQNTGALRDPVTDKMTQCFHCGVRD